jgi:hypothetical protein
LHTISPTYLETMPVLPSWHNKNDLAVFFSDLWKNRKYKPEWRESIDEHSDSKHIATTEMNMLV